ncbi:MAG: hypothetical protein CSA64_01375 [Arachnia propionica]|nr:MAG: hypothetical protein CSA64_01375 [Arachnia propionica]
MSRKAIWAIVAIVVVVLLGVAGTQSYLLLREQLTPDRCYAIAGETKVSLTPEQAGNAAIIVASSFERGLPERAAIIALATAWQESGLRNLDYGDRDSLGLFQQRPSQGWGTPEQIQDPWYSSAKFYEALVKVSDWQTGDITETAQAVQRSAYPDAYRKHEANARALAGALRGTKPGSFGCTGGDLTPGDTQLLDRVLATVPGVEASKTGQQLVLRGTDQLQLWAATQLALSFTHQVGIESATVAELTWRIGPDPAWQTATAGEADTAILELTQ